MGERGDVTQGRRSEGRSEHSTHLSPKLADTNPDSVQHTIIEVVPLRLESMPTFRICGTRAAGQPRDGERDTQPAHADLPVDGQARLLQCLGKRISSGLVQQLPRKVVADVLQAATAATTRHTARPQVAAPWRARTPDTRWPLGPWPSQTPRNICNTRSAAGSAPRPTHRQPTTRWAHRRAIATEAILDTVCILQVHANADTTQHTRGSYAEGDMGRETEGTDGGAGGGGRSRQEIDGRARG